VLEQNNWRGKRVLVTGAGGFIGSHLVEQLVARGARVRAFVRYTSRPQAGFLDTLDASIRESIEIIRGDLRDFNAVLNAVQGVSVIFHLGALIGIPYSYVHPRETVETNVLGTLNVLMAGRIHNVKCIVHTSSSEVYGTARYAPIDEKHPLQGQSPYSASKIGADKVAESFHDSYGLPVVTLRPFNTYGPRQSARAVIPTIITQALADEEIALGNLTPSRDFTYVTDTVAGFVRAAECAAAEGRTINLGTSMEVSIGDLVERIGTIMGKSLQVRQDAVRQRPAGSEVERLIADNSLARDILGWEPQIPLSEGLTRTVEWIAGNLSLYEVGRYEI
jgi:NAD dependent epimerase/dehydratase